MEKSKKIYGWDIGMGDYSEHPETHTADKGSKHKWTLIYPAILAVGIAFVVGLTLVLMS